MVQGVQMGVVEIAAVATLSSTALLHSASDATFHHGLVVVLLAFVLLVLLRYTVLFLVFVCLVSSVLVAHLSRLGLMAVRHAVHAILARHITHGSHTARGLLTLAVLRLALLIPAVLGGWVLAAHLAAHIATWVLLLTILRLSLILAAVLG